MAIPYSKITTPLAVAVSAVLTAVVCSWRISSYLHDQAVLDAANDQKIEDRLNVSNAEVNSQLNELRHAYDMSAQDISNKLERIDDRIGRSDAENLKRADFVRWLERARGTVKELPELPKD